MKANRNIILAVFFIVAVKVNVFAQQTDCMDLYEQVNAKTMQPSSGMRIMEYGVKVFGQTEENENRIKILSDSNHRYIITDMVQVYMDREHSIMLAPGAKTIMINYTNAKEKESLKKPQLDFADSLFRSTVEVTSCKEISDNVLYDREMTVKSRNSKTDFVQIIYYIKSTTLGLYKISVTPRKSDYRKVEYTFYKDSKNLPNDKINRPVIELFFKKEGTLLPAYKGYTLTDNRKISSKN